MDRICNPAPLKFEREESAWGMQLGFMYLSGRKKGKRKPSPSVLPLLLLI